MGARAIRTAALFLVAVSSTALLAALGFQYLGGLAPCEMCWWQRYAHAAVIVVAILALLRPGKLVFRLALLAMLVSAALGLYHAGVEQHWWQGVTSCASGFAAGAGPGALMEQLRNAPLTRCDAIPWQFLGLSMAAWNAIVSFASVLAALGLSREG